MPRSLVVAAALVLLTALPTPAGVSAPPMTEDYISYPKTRKTQMARYSGRHYGTRTWKLHKKKVVVLHFTATSTYQPVWNHFESNSPNRGEYPGVCTHFAVDKDGTIYKMVRTFIRCRHAIGLNHRSIGIEMVQETGEGSRWAAQQILSRRPQIRAALRLVRHLRAIHDVKMRNVIGHAMANNSPFFKDLQGWRNDHTDWMWPEVREFRRRLRAIT